MRQHANPGQDGSAQSSSRSDEATQAAFEGKHMTMGPDKEAADDLVARLKELDAKATPGPWRIGKIGLLHPAAFMWPPELREKHGDGWGVLYWTSDETADEKDVKFRSGEHDEALIAYVRTNLPSIIAHLSEIAALRSQVAAMRAQSGDAAK